MTPQQIENNREWIAELRSGKFIQTKGSLGKSSPESYCCLGVACKSSNLKESKESNFLVFESDLNEGPQVIIAPPNWFKNRYGFDQARLFKIGPTSVPLSIHNDSHDATFDQIADALETFVNEQEQLNTQNNVSKTKEDSDHSYGQVEG